VPYRITRALRDESVHENGGKAPVSPTNVRVQNMYTFCMSLFRRIRKIAKKSVSFVMSVRPTHGTPGLPLHGFS
jgi:hypothetical protein